MATRGTIAIQNEDGTVTGIYTHWDSYLSCNGMILQDHYQDEAKVRELIALGHLSVLGKNIHPTEGSGHSFDNNEADVCVFYGRDRGGLNECAETYANWHALLNHQGQSYNYLFVPGSGWIVEHNGDDCDRVQGPLSAEIAKEFIESA